jgi:hypothetical protein
VTITVLLFFQLFCNLSYSFRMNRSSYKDNNLVYCKKKSCPSISLQISDHFLSDHNTRHEKRRWFTINTNKTLDFLTASKAISKCVSIIWPNYIDISFFVIILYSYVILHLEHYTSNSKSLTAIMYNFLIPPCRFHEEKQTEINTFFTIISKISKNIAIPCHLDIGCKRRKKWRISLTRLRLNSN